MIRRICFLLCLLVSLPASALDAWSCLQDGDRIELSGSVIKEIHADHSPLVLLTEEGYCRSEYSIEQAEQIVTNTNVMRFQLLPGPDSQQNLSSFSGKEVVARGKVYKASEAQHRTPLIIEIEGVVVR